MSFKFILSNIIFLLLIGTLQAQNADVLEVHTKVEPLSFDSTAIESYRLDPNYNYERNAKYESNFLSRLANRFIRWLTDATGIDFGYKLFQLLKYLIIIAALYLMVKFFINSTHGGFVQKKDSNIDEIDAVLVDADMSREDLSKLVEQAEQQGDYRLAVRFNYLLLLRTLDDKELIHWKAEKTNNDFIAEMRSSKLSSNFEDVTRLYEYVWYGEFELGSEHEYLESKHRFDHLFQNLTR